MNEHDGTTMNKQLRDRRLNRRQRARVPVRLCVDERPYLGLTIDVSMGGARIRTDAPCVPSERLLVQLLEREGPVKVDAEVVYHLPREVGVRFLRLTSTSMQRLAAVVSGTHSLPAV
jgi:hypothetical protein